MEIVCIGFFLQLNSSSLEKLITSPLFLQMTVYYPCGNLWRVNNPIIIQAD